MALGTTNITTSLVASEIGELSTDVGALCSSDKINKWSKRKPYVDTRIFRNDTKYWRRSDVAENIRCGFRIEPEADYVWDYLRKSYNCPFRLGDFRGYDHTSRPEITLYFPNEFIIGEDYEASFVFSGFTGDDLASDNIGAIGLHDIFDIQNKYCCLKLEVKVGYVYILRYSDRIAYADGATLFGANVLISASDVNELADTGGSIDMKISLIEADSYNIYTGFVNPIEFSIRAKNDLETHQINNQFRSKGFDIYTNFDTQTPTKTGLVISSSTFEQIVVSSFFKTGGLFSGYYFQARIIGNQLGDNYVYELPAHTLAIDENYNINIPDFSLEMLDNVPSLLEYTVWEGAPNISDLVLKHIYNI